MTHSAIPAPVKVGVVGCGNISSAYFSHAPVFPILEVVACADLNPDAARTQAEKFGVPQTPDRGRTSGPSRH